MHGHIIGKDGHRLEQIQTETAATIKMPPKQLAVDRIEISGPTPDVVFKCKSRVEMILMNARTWQNFTHFISIPVCNDEIKENFLKFKVRFRKIIDWHPIT